MLRDGVRKFFRIVDPGLLTMGDCGAFAYVREERPPFSVGEVVEYYETMGFDFGMSVDHIIFGYDPKAIDPPMEWQFRQDLTLSLARDFLSEHIRVKATFTPIGVAQGWSPKSYAAAVQELQLMGYTYVALGGMIGLKTGDILNCLREMQSVLRPGVNLHILGVTRIDSFREFADLGVTSIDSTSPLRQAFKDMKDNYYAPGRTYTALRVPQVEANPQLVRKIKAGKVDQREARRLEQICLRRLNDFDHGRCGVESTLEALIGYEMLYHDGKSFEAVYREVLEEAPWKRCPCDICRVLGIHVMLFRGARETDAAAFTIYTFSITGCRRRGPRIGTSLMNLNEMRSLRYDAYKDTVPSCRRGQAGTIQRNI